MAGGRQSETYRATLATPFGVQEVRLRVVWRRQRHLTRIILDVSTDPAPNGDITALVGLVPCSVVTANTSVVRSGHGGTALMVGLGPDDRGGRVRRTAVVANVGPHASPVEQVEIEGRVVSPPRRWTRSGSAAVLAGCVATAVVIGVGVTARDVFQNQVVTAVALAGESLDASTGESELTDGVATTISPAPTTTIAATATSIPVTSTTDPSASVDPASIEAAMLARVTGEAANWLVIPRIDLVSPIVRGVEDESLGRGVGRYTMTAKIGSAGNLGLAGHRTTPPAPFRHLDAMQVGDPVLVVTRTEILRYEVEEAGPGRPYIEVRPDEVSVLDARGHDGLTMTTCTPVGTTERRLVVFARLIARTPR